LLSILKQMAYHQIGNRVFYEIVALEFIKNLDAFSFAQKVEIFQILASADIEASSILKTAHTVCSSTLEVLKLQQSEDRQSLGEIDLPPGLYSDTQQRFLEEAAKDLFEFQ
jgi:hypothetical protein